MGKEFDLRKLTNEFYERRNRNDVRGMIDCFAPDGCFRMMGTDRLGAVTQMHQGTDALLAVGAALTENWDLSGLRNVATFVEGDTTLTHRSGSVRYVPTGGEYHTELIDKMTFRDGLIVEYLQFVDTLFIAEITGVASLQ
ncbi:nuclear transport factor 2 family protein [Mangrovicella endophytica]|uniref:nuclear transport factor 2 family protein n=1 Tax=Mangrovicella endophytica TaxID=2066697 RepID=UPI001300041E|nr:nuclear transport factor 2 family protein [Mangrovicella endophytica]